jgi:hypothetical protein
VLVGRGPTSAFWLREPNATLGSLALGTEAVAQRVRAAGGAFDGGSELAIVSVVMGGVSAVGAWLGPDGGEVVAVELGEVVGGHQ